MASNSNTTHLNTFDGKSLISPAGSSYRPITSPVSPPGASEYVPYPVPTSTISTTGDKRIRDTKYHCLFNYPASNNIVDGPANRNNNQKVNEYVNESSNLGEHSRDVAYVARNSTRANALIYLEASFYLHWWWHSYA